MFGIIADLFSSVLTILFPIFASYKALRQHDHSQLAPLLVYWVVLSVFLLAESWTVFILGWVPFYSWFRLFFLCYLVLPQTQGARVLYQQYIDPFLFQHEREIERFIAQSHDQAKALGLQYFYRAIELVREKVLGLPPQQQHGPADASSAPGGNAGAYAQSLFSMFGGGGGGASSGNTSGGAGGNAGGAGGAGGAGNWFSSAMGGQGPSDSDHSFQHVSHEDTQERPAGGNWASGLFGQGQGGSSAVDIAARAAEEFTRR